MTDHAMPVAASRGRLGAGGAFTLLTPANRYPSRLPHLDGIVYKLATPRLAAARFGEYVLDIEAGGALRDVAPGFEDFLYGLAGDARLSGGVPLGAGGWCYLPPGEGFTLEAGDAPAQVLWLKRRWEPFADLAEPDALHGHREDAPWEDTGVPGFRRRELIPPRDPRHDFNMSLLAFDPGTGLDKVEVHDEEHGLYMTAGGGIYHLDGEQLEVRRDDFIYMAPYCPQSFVATGAEPAEYLLYKDVYRDGF
jgi:(S)-ureidoglycine aminohydrolase